MGSLRVTGLNECLSSFDDLPKEALKMTKKAFNAGAKACAKTAKAGMPGRFKHLISSKVFTVGGDIVARFGLYNDGSASGHQNNAGSPVSDWFKAYWLNYGTLDNRDPQHHFENPVKSSRTASGKRRGSSQGIRPRHYIETAAQGWESTFRNAFEQSLSKQKSKYFNNK